MKVQWIKFKEWWLNLAAREQQALIIGTIVLGVIIIYQCIWSPFIDYVGDLRHQVQAKEKMLAWMQTMDKEIRQVENNSNLRSKPLAPVVLLSFLQKQISHARLDSQLSQLRQVSADSLEMHFQKVEFDKFIRLLMLIIKEQHVAISQLSIRVESAPGIVTADVMLRLFS